MDPKDKGKEGEKQKNNRAALVDRLEWIYLCSGSGPGFVLRTRRGLDSFEHVDRIGGPLEPVEKTVLQAGRKLRPTLEHVPLFIAQNLTPSADAEK